MKLKKFYEYYMPGTNPIYFIIPPVGINIDELENLTDFKYWIGESPNSKKRGIFVEIPEASEQKSLNKLYSQLEEKWPGQSWSSREKTW